MKIIWFLILKNVSVCYLAVLCLSCGTQDFRSSLRHVESLLAACEVLATGPPGKSLDFLLDVGYLVIEIS